MRSVELAVLAAMFEEPCGPDAHSTARAGLPLADFQRDAVRTGLRALRQWGGVLLCDDVGLGKTWVALELARITIEAGGKVMIVLPASLRPQWIPLIRRYLRPETRVAIITLSQLSRSGCPDRWKPSFSARASRDLVIVDEAHALRNPETRRYRAFAEVAAGRDVCMITATPVNNSIHDLYHLIRLFARDDHFATAGISSLTAVFDDAAHASSRPASLQRLLNEVMIRRTRADAMRSHGPSQTLRPCSTPAPSVRRPLSARRSRKAFDATSPAGSSVPPSFPRLDPPRSLTYDPDGAMRGSHQRILYAIEQLDLTACAPAGAQLLKFLLLKRLASSTVALASTVNRIARFHRDFLAACGEGLRLVNGSAVGLDPDRVQLSLNGILLRPFRPDDDIDAIRTRVSADLALLQHIGALLRRSSAIDHKSARLKHLVHDELAHTQVLVFTEFRETAMHLWRVLSGSGGIGLVAGDTARLGRGTASRAAVIARFQDNTAHRFRAHERVRVLIATDVMSEGFNLQSCAHVVSYDLPWNPVRLLQRIGRIDRLGSPHDTVYAWNFMPHAHLDAYLRLITRLRIKFHAIDLALGLDRPVLATGEEQDDVSSWMHLRDPSLYYERARNGEFGAPPDRDYSAGHLPGSCTHERLRARLDQLRRLEDTNFDADDSTAIRVAVASTWQTAGTPNPHCEAPHDRRLPACDVGPITLDTARACVFVHAPRLRAFAVSDDDTITEIDVEDAAARLATLDDMRDGAGHDGATIGNTTSVEMISCGSAAIATGTAIARVAFDRMMHLLSDTRPQQNASPSRAATVAAGTLMNALRHTPGGPTARQTSEAEHIFGILSQPLHALQEMRLDDVAPTLESLPATDLLSRLAAVLATPASTQPRFPIRPVAVVVLRPFNEGTFLSV